MISFYSTGQRRCSRAYSYLYLYLYSPFSILYPRRFWKNTSPTTKMPTTTNPITIHKIEVEAADGGTAGAAGWEVGVAVGLAAGSGRLITGETGD
jgi:hypothetical protein